MTICCSAKYFASKMNVAINKIEANELLVAIRLPRVGVLSCVLFRCRFGCALSGDCACGGVENYKNRCFPVGE